MQYMNTYIYIDTHIHTHAHTHIYHLASRRTDHSRPSRRRRAIRCVHLGL